MTYKIIDLTHVMIPGEEQYTVTIQQRGALREAATGDIMHDVYMWSHSGTHIEMPLHFYANGKDTASYAPDQFVGSAIRLDFRHKAVNEAITLDELKAADIREGDIVILWEGRDGQYRTQASHQRPYVAADAAEYLALEKKIKLLGADSSGFEVRGRNDHPNHHLFFREDVAIPVVECLRNLGAISADRFFFVGLPLPVKGLDASPIRAIAIEGITL
jgi:arylformamidase